MIITPLLLATFIYYFFHLVVWFSQINKEIKQNVVLYNTACTGNMLSILSVKRNQWIWSGGFKETPQSAQRYTTEKSGEIS